MDKYQLMRKGFTIGIILLFVGAGIIPVIAKDREKLSLPASSGNWLTITYWWIFYV